MSLQTSFRTLFRNQQRIEDKTTSGKQGSVENKISQPVSSIDSKGWNEARCVGLKEADEVVICESERFILEMEALIRIDSCLSENKDLTFTFLRCYHFVQGTSKYNYHKKFLSLNFPFSYLYLLRACQSNFKSVTVGFLIALSFVS